ncbi:hypothetical protein [Photobacterium galatheae]|uniref:Uncharacterized protein n=1 Tax=Photobacterium galatheae TaxID=1654360 RepID=A0A066RRH1_9GAMM|nr:hypothetical protein [Photobacterium galatheae]KDM90267.1 hypothetical protein EA58_18310 [Photobacterium galatheae]MCM0151471.1 hypothetical protein [Photobacterium galatheae]
MSDQRLLTIPTFGIMLEHHTIMRDVIREMDEAGEPYVHEAKFVARLHRYMQGLNRDKRKQLRTAFSTDNLLAAHILVDKDEFGGESRLIFDRSVIGVFRLFDRSLFQDLTDVALKTQLGGLRLLLDQLESGSVLFSDADLDYKELMDELFHRLSELLNSIRLNLVKMQTINQELSEASEQAAKAENPQAFSLLQRESIGKISHLLSRHILPTRQFLDEKSRLKDGPNLFECLQKLRRQFELHQDYQRATAMLRYEISFNSFHNQISKVSHSVDQFLARSKKRLKQFNAIEAAFGELADALDATRHNLKRSLIDGEFARKNGAFMGLMQQARPKVLRISSSEAYLNNVVSDIEARVADQNLLIQNRYVELTSSKDDSTERRLARAEQIYHLVKQMQMAEYHDLTLALHRRLKTNLAGYHFVDLLEGLNFVLRGDEILDEHHVKVTNYRNRLAQDETVYLYRKIRTERVKQ